MASTNTAHPASPIGELDGPAGTGTCVGDAILPKTHAKKVQTRRKQIKYEFKKSTVYCPR